MADPVFESRVLVIEPEPDWRDRYATELTKAGVEHDIVDYGVTAEKRILEGGYDGVITAGYQQSWVQVVRATKRVGAAAVVISGADWLRHRVEAEGAKFVSKAEVAGMGPDFMTQVLGWMHEKVQEHKTWIAARNQRS